MFLALPQADFLKGFCAIYKVSVAPAVVMSLFEKLRKTYIYSCHYKGVSFPELFKLAPTLFKNVRIADMHLIFCITIISLKDKQYHDDIKRTRVTKKGARGGLYSCIRVLLD